MTFSGIRKLMRSPRKPFRNCTFSGCSRGLDSMMIGSCPFTNAMLNLLQNMLMSLGLPLSLQQHRGKFWNTCKNARAEPFLDSATLHMRILLRHVGLSLLLIGEKVFVVGLPKGSLFLNVLLVNGLLPPIRLESHSRNLHNACNYSQLRIRTPRFKNSSIPYFINLLNKYIFIPCEPATSMCNIVVLFYTYISIHTYIYIHSFLFLLIQIYIYIHYIHIFTYTYIHSYIHSFVFLLIQFFLNHNCFCK